MRYYQVVNTLLKNGRHNMNKYKVLANKTFNDYEIELKEYQKCWGVAVRDKNNKVKEVIETNYNTACIIYHFSEEILKEARNENK